MWPPFQFDTIVSENAYRASSSRPRAKQVGDVFFNMKISILINALCHLWQLYRQNSKLYLETFLSYSRLKLVLQILELRENLKGDVCPPDIKHQNKTNQQFFVFISESDMEKCAKHPIRLF